MTTLKNLLNIKEACVSARFRKDDSWKEAINNAVIFNSKEELENNKKALTDLIGNELFDDIALGYAIRQINWKLNNGLYH